MLGLLLPVLERPVDLQTFLPFHRHQTNLPSPNIWGLHPDSTVTRSTPNRHLCSRS